KTFKFNDIEKGSGMTVRQRVELQEGISKENAKKVNKMIKGSKLKVQSQIQGEQIRVTGKKIDDLQSIISFLKKENLDIPLQFINMKK
ncbi:MAG: nucleotide-binding protein, partial [Candidatus Marinimicrobia bacterium]|nr:nucleotide-binding protein [Candidatus Neomarinimicrobiota bacterium]